MSNLQHFPQEELDALTEKQRKAEYAKRWRAEKLTNGLCKKCHNQPICSASKCHCEDCHAYHKEWDRARREKTVAVWREAGLCVGCGKERQNLKFKNCDDCRARVRPKAKIKSAQVARDKKAKGVCIRCGAPSERWRCDACMIEQNEYAAKRTREAKLQAISYLGGKCVDCNLVSHIPQVYDFHHLDPAQKDFKLATLAKSGFDKMKPELDKCVLLCAVCHRIRHATNPSFEEIVEEVA